MADRADYLARTLVSRLANLDAAFAEDGRGAPDRRERMATIEKVLAVELGVTDGSMISVIESAVPDRTALRQSPDQEIAKLAEFLRRRLAAHLEE